MKRLLAITLMPALFIALTLAACNKDQPQNTVTPGPGKVLAVVGDHQITEADVDKLIETQRQQMAAQGRPINDQMINAMKTKVLDYLINLELFKQEAVRRGIEIPETEVEQAFTEEVTRMGGPAQLQQALTQRGWTEVELKDRVRQYLIIRKIHDSVTADVPSIKEEEARTYFEQNQAQFNSQESVHAYHILIKVDQNAPEEKVKEAEKKINEILKEARKKGADFQELARKYSEGPSGPKGGDLGTFTRGRMVPPFEEAAFALEPGNISDVVKSPFGFHIIKVTEHLNAGAKKFEDVKDNLIQMLSSKNKEEQFTTFIAQLKAGAKITYPNPLPQALPLGGGFHGQQFPPGHPTPGGGQKKPTPEGSSPKKAPEPIPTPEGSSPKEAPEPE